MSIAIFANDAKIYLNMKMRPHFYLFRTCVHLNQIQVFDKKEEFNVSARNEIYKERHLNVTPNVIAMTAQKKRREKSREMRNAKKSERESWKKIAATWLREKIK